MRNPTQVFTRAMLLNKLWEIDQLSGAETIKTHITNLRRKLREAGSPIDFIETVYGVGYRLCSLNPR
jgi:DNA-binding response OmpR family regulator